MFNRTAKRMPKYRLLIGNPGVGKSTIANCMAKTVLFSSGFHTAKGMSYQLEEKKHEEITYLDTPGLADINTRKAAANSITEGLKRGGYYQIFFVVTLEAGRVRAADLTTIKLVLNAADITSYSLIINKLSKREYDNLHKNNGEEFKILASELNFQAGNRQNSARILLLLKNDSLDDAENKIVELEELEVFVGNASYIEVRPRRVKDILSDHESFDSSLNSVIAELNQLRNDKEAMAKKVQTTVEKYESWQEKKVKFLLLFFYLLSFFLFFLLTFENLI